MKRCITLSLFLSAFTFSSSSTFAEDKSLSFSTSLGFANKSLSFDQKGFENNVQIQQGSFDVDLPAVQLGLGASYGALGFSIKYEDSNNAIAIYSDVPFSGPETRVERDDIVYTLSYEFTEAISIFAGYMDGKTELTPTPYATPTLDPVDPLGAEPTYDQNLAMIQQVADLAGGNNGQYKQTYEESGLFLGANYTMYFMESLNGALTFTLAYADLDGSYVDNYLVNESLNFNFEGSTTGVSVAATWTGFLTDSLLYKIDLRQHSFDMTGNDKSGNFDGASVETSEDITSISAGLTFNL